MAEVFKELTLRYREFFESRLAVELLHSTEPFSSVQSVSENIMTFMTANKRQVEALIRDNPSIISELREPYFGGLYTATAEVNETAVFDDILRVLNDHQADLSCVMQLHCLFIHRIYRPLTDDAALSALHESLHPAEFFSADNRARQIGDHLPIATQQWGFAKNKVYAMKLGHSAPLHVRGVDKFTPVKESAYFSFTQAHQLPFACGPSSHTSSLMLGAKLYGELSADALQEYALISFAFLAAGGHHSFHEVMTVARLAGVDYQPGAYASCIPPSVQTTSLYKSLRQEFPQFLACQPVAIEPAPLI